MSTILFLAALVIGLATIVSAWRHSPWAAGGLVLFWVWCIVGGEVLGVMLGIW